MNLHLKPTALLAAGLLAATALLTPVHTVAGGDEHARHAGATVTLKGEIVDLGCYLGHDSKGPAHTKCALACAQKGMPIGLLTDDGTLYLLTLDHADNKPYEAAKAKAGSILTVTGIVHDAHGMKSLEVKGVK